MQYQYTVKNSDGKELKGVIDAPSEKDAISLLKEKNFFITKIESKQEELSALKLFQKKISLKDKILFTKQLAIMIRSGLSILEALKSLSEESGEKDLNIVISKVIVNVEGGAPFSEALAKHPSVFNETYINMIRSGEKSGQLDLVLERLAAQQEKDYELVRKIKGALSYPVFVMIAMVVVICLVIVLVIPQLKVVFDDAGVSLPALTKGLIALSFFLKDYGIYVAILLLGAAFALYSWRKTEGGRFFFDKFIVNIPVFGMLIKKTYMARFTRTFSALTSSGLPLLEVFKSSGAVLGNVVYKKEIDLLSKKVENGESISSVFKKSKIFPSMIGQLAAVGEKSGKIDEVFENMADFYDKDVDNAASTLSTMLEPILMVVMGIGIGLVIISVLQPIYGLVNAI